MNELFKLIENEFNIWDDYVSRFDLSNPDMKRKAEHSINTAETMYKLRPNELSLLIGLYHDIGRFPQYEAFHAFDDEISFDHGKAGADLTHTLLKGTELYEDNKEIINTAIRHHNDYKIPDELKDYELLYTQLIRDADKIDIMQNVLYKERSDIDYNNLNEDNIRYSVKEQFFDHKLIDNKLFNEVKRTDEEEIVQIIAFSYDINLSKDFVLNILKTYFDPIFEPYMNEATRYLKESGS